MICLYIDDIRTPQLSMWNIVRSSQEAIDWIEQNGIPDAISFDHDLGLEDTSMVFLKSLYEKYPEGCTFAYYVHSANPIGKENIISFINSWRKAMDIKPTIRNPEYGWL